MRTKQGGGKGGKLKSNDPGQLSESNNGINQAAKSHSMTQVFGIESGIKA